VKKLRVKITITNIVNVMSFLGYKSSGECKIVVSANGHFAGEAFFCITLVIIFRQTPKLIEKIVEMLFFNLSQVKLCEINYFRRKLLN